MTRFTTVLATLLLAATGCASKYATPGRGADMAELGVTPAARQSMTDTSLQGTLDRKPLAQFPTGIAMVRVQAPGYYSKTAQGYGTGKFCVITTRDVEADEQVARIEKLPMTNGIAAVNRLLLPTTFNSDLDLRQAAAALHADMLLVYTLDTTFTTNDAAEPLTILTLGLSPNQSVRVVCTASAVLMDTRNGYIYAVCEATEKQGGLTNAWGSESAVENTRRHTESAAFEKLVAEFEKAWAGVLKQNTTVYRTGTGG